MFNVHFTRVGMAGAVTFCRERVDDVRSGLAMVQDKILYMYDSEADGPMSAALSLTRAGAVPPLLPQTVKVPFIEISLHPARRTRRSVYRVMQHPMAFSASQACLLGLRLLHQVRHASCEVTGSCLPLPCPGSHHIYDRRTRPKVPTRRALCNPLLCNSGLR